MGDRLDREVQCPHCKTDVVLDILPADYCATRWGRPEMDEHGRVQCPLCSATFRKDGFEKMLDRK